MTTTHQLNKKIGRRTAALWALICLASTFTTSVLANDLGDFVWHDLNRNGIQDPGEPGLNGVTVTVYNCADNTLATVDNAGPDPLGNPLQGNPQVTRNNGVNDGYYFFKFRQVTSDVYLVFTLPTGYTFTLRNQGSDDTKDSDVDPLTGRTECIELHCFGWDDPHCFQLQWDVGLVTIPTNLGTGTPGYWKNHPNAWPVSNITIGGVSCTKAQALVLLKLGGSDKSITLFHSLLSAKLNVIIGNESDCIDDTIAAADLWMTAFPPGSNVRGSSAAWKLGEPLHQLLDAYNNGLLCAPHRD